MSHGRPVGTTAAWAFAAASGVLLLGVSVGCGPAGAGAWPAAEEGRGDWGTVVIGDKTFRTPAELRAATEQLMRMADHQARYGGLHTLGGAFDYLPRYLDSSDPALRHEAAHLVVQCGAVRWAALEPFLGPKYPLNVRMAAATEFVDAFSLTEKSLEEVKGGKRNEADARRVASMRARVEVLEALTWTSPVATPFFREVLPEFERSGEPGAALEKDAVSRISLADQAKIVRRILYMAARPLQRKWMSGFGSDRTRTIAAFPTAMAAREIVRWYPGETNLWARCEGAWVLSDNYDQLVTIFRGVEADADKAGDAETAALARMTLAIGKQTGFDLNRRRSEVEEVEPGTRALADWVPPEQQRSPSPAAFRHFAAMRAAVQGAHYHRPQELRRATVDLLQAALEAQPTADSDDFFSAEDRWDADLFLYLTDYFNDSDPAMRNEAARLTAWLPYPIRGEPFRKYVTKDYAPEVRMAAVIRAKRDYPYSSGRLGGEESAYVDAVVEVVEKLLAGPVPPADPVYVWSAVLGMELSGYGFEQKLILTRRTLQGLVYVPRSLQTDEVSRLMGLLPDAFPGQLAEWYAAEADVRTRRAALQALLDDSDISEKYVPVLKIAAGDWDPENAKLAKSILDRMSAKPH